MDFLSGKKILGIDSDRLWLSYLNDLLYDPASPLIIELALDDQEAMPHIGAADLLILGPHRKDQGWIDLLKNLLTLRPGLPVLLILSEDEKETQRLYDLKKIGVTGVLNQDSMEDYLWASVVTTLVLHPLTREN